MRELLELDEPYLATCVRRDDKNTEVDYASLDSYVEHISSLEIPFRSVFIAGDDQAAIEALADRLRNFECFHLRSPFPTGFDISSFRRATSESRRGSMVRFFAQVEFLRRASHFVGTRTTNVAYVVNALRSGERVSWFD
jgi:hypothetical protein